MKKFLVVFFIIFSVALFFAHTPSSVNVYLDSSNNVIIVDVKHDIENSKVMDPVKHFIKEITLTVNGKIIETKVFKMQDSKMDQMTAFIVPSYKSGDKITVEAKCNLSGVKTGELMVQ